MDSDFDKTPRKSSSANRLRIISRRGFLMGGSILVLGASTITGFLALQPTLKALVDTLIPADEFGPSASETGAVEMIWATTEGHSSRQLRIRMALTWLNLKAGGSFAMSSEEKRIALLGEIFARPSKDKLRRFATLMRTLTMRHYYGDARRALALGFVGPPQPAGHVDAALPWKDPS